MSEIYVPPHARSRGKAARDLNVTTIETDATSSENVQDGRNFRRQASHSRLENCFRFVEIHKHFWPDHTPYQERCANHYTGTLNDSAAKPNSLQHIIIFDRADPRWESDKIVFVHLNLRLLGFPVTEKDQAKQIHNPDDKNAQPTPPAQTHKPRRGQDTGADLLAKRDMLLPQGLSMPARDKYIKQYQERMIAQSWLEPRKPRPFDPDTPPALTIRLKKPPRHPVPVFKEVKPVRSRAERWFEFVGYHRVARMQYVPARSVDLVRLLQQKWQAPITLFPPPPCPATVAPFVEGIWSATPIDRDPEWERPLGMPWVVVKMEAVSGRELRELGLGMPRVSRGPAWRQGVNEMLWELRLADGAVDGESRDGVGDAQMG